MSSLRFVFTFVFMVMIVVGPVVAQDFNTGTVTGAYVLDRMGKLYSNGNVGSPTFGSVFFGTDAAVDIEFTPTGNGLWLLDKYGGLHPAPASIDAITTFTDPIANETDSSMVPYFAVPVVVDFEPIPQSNPADNTTWGAFVLDHFGGVHTVGSAEAVMLPPTGFATPYFGYDIARDLEVTSTGAGYFILDGLGAVHAVGDAINQIPDPMGIAYPYFFFDIAKDLELVLNDPLPATAETGWYMLDGIGAVHTLGTPLLRPGAPAGANPYLNPALDEIYFFFDIARDLEIMQNETIFELDGSGGIHPNESAYPQYTYPFALEDGQGNPYHYMLGMDMMVDMEFLRE